MANNIKAVISEAELKKQQQEAANKGSEDNGNTSDGGQGEYTVVYGKDDTAKGDGEQVASETYADLSPEELAELTPAAGAEETEADLSDLVTEESGEEVSVTLTLSKANAASIKAKLSKDVQIETDEETGEVTFSGDAAAVKSALASVVFVHNTGYTDNFDLSISSGDFSQSVSFLNGSDGFKLGLPANNSTSSVMNQMEIAQNDLAGNSFTVSFNNENTSKDSSTSGDDILKAGTSDDLLGATQQEGSDGGVSQGLENGNGGGNGNSDGNDNGSGNTDVANAPKDDAQDEKGEQENSQDENSNNNGGSSQQTSKETSGITETETETETEAPREQKGLPDKPESEAAEAQETTIDPSAFIPESGNLIVNGGFENTSVSDHGGSWEVFESGIDGWNVVSGPGVEIQTGNTGGIGASEGNNKVELDSHNASNTNSCLSLRC